MKTQRALALLLWVAAISSSVSAARADEFLIRETESLRNSLSLNDASRLPLTLRLADLCMEDAASAEYSRKVKLQRQALGLYDEALQFNRAGALEGNGRLRVEFQKARLMTDLGDMDRAVVLWKKIANQRDMKDMAREASLKLAEAGDVHNAAHWFQFALDLCSGGDLCSYVHYKRAWLMKQGTRSGLADDKAISEIELALFDAKGQVREEALRDYLVFLGERGAGNAHDPVLLSTLSKVESLAQKLNRPTLIADLAESFFAAGHKTPGTVVLAQVQRQQPNFQRMCRLAEEQYGARDWDSFRLTLEELAGPQGKALLSRASDSERKEGEKLVRRLVIQLDGERISQVDRKPDFQRSTLAYLELFPGSPEKAKFQEGFLASENDAQIKLQQLGKWIAESPSNTKLREFRASVAQKAGMTDLMATEMAALAQLTGSREHRYLQARALYEAKNYSDALPIFISLSSVTTGTPDKWAIQSQNLALDILAMDKSPSGLSKVIAQASAWIDASWAKSAQADLKHELSEMAKIRDQASFEKAVGLGQTPEALAQFMTFCRTGFFADKSCENARVLSIQLKDQPALLAVLALMGPAQQGALAAEYEGAGDFAKAADLLEKQASQYKPDLNAIFKITLLRELSGDSAQWSRSIRKITDSKIALTEQQERLWVAMSRDASILDASAFKSLKSIPARAQVAEILESSGKGTSETRKILISAPLMTGPAWKAAILAQVDSDIASQKKITFYGRNSKALFEKRLKAVGTLAKQVDDVVGRSDEATRSAIAFKMQGVYEDLAKEIRESPIPAGLPEAAIPELKAGLDEMAKPFDEKVKVYAAAVTPVTDTVTTLAAHADVAPAADAQTRITAAMAIIKKNPDSGEALSQLKDAYKTLKKERLASYFEGRLQARGNAQ